MTVLSSIKLAGEKLAKYESRHGSNEHTRAALAALRTAYVHVKANGGK